MEKGMEGIDWGGVAVAVGIVSPIVGWIVRIVAEQRREISALGQKIETVKSEGAHSLAAYKLEVAQQYASQAYLQEVERRLLMRLDKIADSLESLARAFGEYRVEESKRRV